MRIRAFTLAEVLITIGIIGAVAALTIPSLIANTNSQHYRAMFKKSLSTLNQAGRMAQAKYEVNYGSVTSACGDNAATENLEYTYTFCAILNGTLAGATYLGSPQNYKIQMYGFEYTPDDMIAYGMSDGSMVMFNQLAGGCNAGKIIDAEWVEEHPQCVGYIDVNGNKNPNKLVTCNNEALNNSDIYSCNVSADRDHMTDVYPVLYYDGTVEPASPAARSVLTNNSSGEIEASAVLSSPGEGGGGQLCHAKVNGCDPCRPCYTRGFNKTSLQGKLREQGMTLRP